MTQQTLPSGTITFLFTDIEGSTRLWEAHPRAMETALRLHDEILRDAIESNGGMVFKTVGDAFYAAFPTTIQGIEAAIQAQRQLATRTWPVEIGALRVRMALHSGSADQRDGDYFGPPLNKVARLLSVGHGGQVLLTTVAAELAQDSLPPDIAFLELGTYRLKDLAEPETIFQLVAEGLGTTFLPLRTMETGRQNLPSPVTSLIGRQKEVEDLTTLLADSGVRLVTLTGVGGTGKTRLGLQVATKLQDRYEHGVYFADLSTAADLNGVVRAIGESLGTAQRGQDEPQALLESYLSGRHLLLVLDNFEQVISAAPLVGDLMAAAPRLQVLVTSRERLQISGEHEYLVRPLSVPTSANGSAPGELLDYEAIALFVDRARLVNRDFQLDATNAREVAAICARLDGLPLAIELAAARIRIFTPQVLLARLDERLRTLSSGMRDVPERQRTLQGAIDWSYNLLDAGEKQLFRRLAVFNGGFGIEAAEAICGPGLPLDVLDGLDQLLNKSLIRRMESSTDQPRFTMFETIGEYARLRLNESDENEAMQARHAAYFYEMTAALGFNLRTHQQLAWFSRLDPERNNLRASLRYYLDGADVARGVEMTGAMSEYWLYSYQYNEAKEWLDRAIELRSSAAAPLQVDVLSAGGLLAAYRHAEEEGMFLLEQAIELARELKDPRREAWAQIWWTVNALNSKPVEARQATLEGLETFRAIDYPHGIIQALNIYGEDLRVSGELDAAEAVYAEIIAPAQQIGDYRRLAMQYANLASIAYLRGDAINLLHFARLGFPVAITYHVDEVVTFLLLLVGQVAAKNGLTEIAALLAGASAAWHADTSVEPQLTDISMERQAVQEIQHHVGPAAFEDGLQRGATLGLRSAVALANEAIAQLEAAVSAA